MYIRLKEEIIVFSVSSLEQSFPKNIKNIRKYSTQGGGARYLYYMLENKVYQTKKHRYQVVVFERGKQYVFKDKMIKEGTWNLDEYVDEMQNEMTNCVKRVIKDIIEKSKGYG